MMVSLKFIKFYTKNYKLRNIYLAKTLLSSIFEQTQENVDHVVYYIFRDIQKRTRIAIEEVLERFYGNFTFSSCSGDAFS